MSGHDVGWHRYTDHEEVRDGGLVVVCVCVLLRCICFICEYLPPLFCGGMLILDLNL